MSEVRNGWTLYQTRLFRAQLGDLAAEVRELRGRDPDGYRSHPRAKLLRAVRDAILERVPVDPAAPEFRLGNTLGASYRHWFRVKQGLPDRYRLFFRFDAKRRVVVYVWLNDETTLRKAGARTDVYATFKRLLASGRVPDALDELLGDAKGRDAER